VTAAADPIDNGGMTRPGASARTLAFSTVLALVALASDGCGRVVSDFSIEDSVCYAVEHGRHPDPSTIGAGLLRGRVRVQATWVPMVGAADLAASGVGWVRVFGQGSLNGIEINTTSLNVVAVVMGKRLALPAAQISPWRAFDQIQLDVTLGGGAATGSYAYAGDVRFDLGTTTDTHDLWLGDGQPVGIGCDGDPAYSWGVLTSLSVHDVAAAAALPTLVIHASPTGGSSAPGTGASPASLARAQDLAQAEVAQGGHPLVWGHAGTYFLSSTLALGVADQGTRWVAYPGEQPIFDGGTPISGPWAGPDADGVYRAPFAGRTRELYVNGTRATIARHALPAGTEVTPIGFTDDGTIASLAHPEDSEIVAWGDASTSAAWKWFLVRVAAAKGTTVFGLAPGWTEAYRGQGGAPGGVNITTESLRYLQNAKEWVKDAPSAETWWYLDSHAGVLYVKPASDVTLSESTVVAGNLEALVTIGGADAAHVAGPVTFAGFQLQHSTWLEPDALGVVVANDDLLNFSTSTTFTTIARHHYPGALTTRYCSGARIWGTIIEQVGANALDCEDGTAFADVNGNVITDVGAGGIWIGDGTTSAAIVIDLGTPVATPDGAALTGGEVVGNTVDGVGKVYPSGSALHRFWCADWTIAYNTFANGGASGLSLNGGVGYVVPTPTSINGGNVVRGNRIANFGGLLADDGWIYTNGVTQSERIFDNYLVDLSTQTNSSSDTNGIYLDNGSGPAAPGNLGVLVEGNVITMTTNLHWLRVQDFGPAANGCTVEGNWYGTSGVGYSIGTGSGNRIGGNVNDTTRAGAQAVIAAAGRL